MNTERLKNLHRTQLSEKYFSHNLPEVYTEILNRYTEDIDWKEKLYLYLNDMDFRPTCPICGKPSKFNSVFKGYFTHCSVQCSGKSQHRLERIHRTMKDRYGVEHALQSQICRERYEKTSIKKYGVSNVSKTTEYKEKVKSTMMEKYGGIGSSSEIIRSKVVDTRRKNRMKLNIINEQIGYDSNGNWILRCSNPHQSNVCKTCDKTFVISSHLYLDRCRIGYPLCTKIYPVIDNPTKNTSLELFVQNILDEYGIEYQTNVRDVIPPKEVDIYIPSKNIAIECNGIYWHSYKDPQYHIEKYSACRKNGVQLLSIWEDWIRNKPEVVKSILKSKLGLIERKIYARHCSVKVVDSKTCKLFLDSNHIQGSSPASVKLGLYYNGELVSLMTFSKSRMGVGKNEDGYELVRFCNLSDTNIIGGASKLLKYFIKQYNPTKIISYSSNDISNGHLYETLGFHSDHVSSGAYWYISQNNFERYHRLSFCKSRLKDLGYDTEGKTESQIMSELPYWRIYDSGTTRWVLLLNK